MTQFPGCVSFKVSDTPATVLHPGCTVKMSNLKSEAGKAVNGKEGVLGTFDAASGGGGRRAAVAAALAHDVCAGRPAGDDLRPAARGGLGEARERR